MCRESEREDVGAYTLTIKNEHGQDSASAAVEVVGMS